MVSVILALGGVPPDRIDRGRLFNDPDNRQGIQDARDADREKALRQPKFSAIHPPAAKPNKRRCRYPCCRRRARYPVAEGKVVADHGGDGGEPPASPTPTPILAASNCP